METHCNTKTYFMKDPSKYIALKSFLDNPRAFIYTNFESEPKASKLHATLGLSAKTSNSYIYRYGIRDLIINDMNSMEDEIYSLLTDLGIENINKYDKNQIAPYPLDFYLPEYGIAFNCNYTSNHNSTVGLYHKDDLREARYHQIQTEMCEDRNIFLYHIFSYEWYNNYDKVVSDIKRILNKNSIIDANDCKLIEIHSLGSYNIRLIYDKEEVLSMKFVFKGDSSYELKDISYQDGITVENGYDVLFNYFIANHFPKSIVSYNDRATVPNDMYESLGFKKQYKTDPDFKWVDIKNDIGYSKLCVSTHNIQNFLKDRKIDLSKPISTIMYEHGYVKVFDSGKNFWKWTLNDN